MHNVFVYAFMVCLTMLLTAHVRGRSTALNDFERMWKEATVVT